MRQFVCILLYDNFTTVIVAHYMDKTDSNCIIFYNFRYTTDPWGSMTGGVARQIANYVRGNFIIK